MAPLFNIHDVRRCQRLPLYLRFTINGNEKNILLPKITDHHLLNTSHMFLQNRRTHAILAIMKYRSEVTFVQLVDLEFEVCRWLGVYPMSPHCLIFTLRAVDIIMPSEYLTIRTQKFNENFEVLHTPGRPENIRCRRRSILALV